MKSKLWNWVFTRRKEKQVDDCQRGLTVKEEEQQRSFNFSSTESSKDAMEPKTDLIKDAVRDKNVKQARVKMDEKRVSKAVGGGKKGAGKRNESEGPRFRDIGGMSKVLEDLIRDVLSPLCHPQVPKYLGVTPVGGILLHGPPGCGKTMLANAIANETGLPFYKISSTSGAPKEKIRDLFSKAIRTAPSIVFIDDIDAIASKSVGQIIVTRLMNCMDESRQKLQTRHVLVIGATNHLDELDPALRRLGKFDTEIYLGVPDEKARVQILSVLTRGLKLEGSFDLLKIARMTRGYVGADLAYLANKAVNIAMQRIMYDRKNMLLNNPKEDSNAIECWKRSWVPDELENLSITMDDFEEAVKMVQPSLMREGFFTIPDVKWEDVGGLDDLRKVFTSQIVKRIMFPGKCEQFGLDFDTGFLLYGPPGCGKTLLAKAVANEAGANFIHVKGPEVLKNYVGSERIAVREIFNRARTRTPCILFFDEVDALTTKWVVESVKMQLRTELDGCDKRSGVFVIGATNRREEMDPAFLRPGRFGKHLYVGYPSPDQRAQILKAISRKKPIDPDVDLDALAKSPACENFSGADLSALVHEASLAAFEEAESGNAGSASTIRMKHFEEALAANCNGWVWKIGQPRYRLFEGEKLKLLGGIPG